MDKNLLVQIFVPAADPDGRGSIGTGYPVAKDRILTARHVIYPKNRAQGELGQARWYHQEGERRDWRPISRVLWDGGEIRDVVVVECPFPAGVEGWGKLASDMPEDHVTWVSEGFANAGKREDGGGPPVPLKGETYSMAHNMPVFHLGVDDPACEPSQWTGASGSPVFVGGRIQGVIVSVPGHFMAHRFTAMPAWKLLEDQAFVQAIGWRTAIAKPTAFYLASLVNTDKLLKQINQLALETSNCQGGKALAFVFADFAEECPDSINFKLLHRLGSELAEPHKLVPDRNSLASSEPAGFLFGLLKAKLHAKDASAEAIREILEKSASAQVFVHELSDRHAVDEKFIAGLVDAWESLRFDAQRPCHFLILLHERQDGVTWWQRWRLRRWVSCMRHCLAQRSGRVIEPEASPTILLAHLKTWITCEVALYKLLTYQQENDLEDRVRNYFDKPKQPKPYVKIRPKIQSDLKAILSPPNAS